MKLLGLYGERLNTAQDIIRMWADGKLLYDKRPGAIRVYKRGLSFKLFPGTSDQAVNPTISAAEGAANTPAFRDTVYAWFHRLPLEDFGNRIPNITCELSYNLTDGRFQSKRPVNPPCL